jgi:SAM-dependent methyltransferase
LHYQRERLAREHLNAFYRDDYFCYQSFSERGAIVRFLSGLTARMQVRAIEKLRPPSCDLFVDFGCGSGSWLELFRAARAPWRMIGTELSESNVEHVRRLGFEAHVCDDATIDRVFAPASVGMLFMHHVIEHLPDAARTLRRLRDILVPGGIVIGQTPDVDAVERRLYGDHWSQWHLPHHLVLFNRATLGALARKAGLEVVRFASSPSGATQWSGSLLKRRAAHRGRVFRWCNEPMHPALTLAFAPLAVVQCALGNSSHLDFVLRRPHG